MPRSSSGQHDALALVRQDEHNPHEQPQSSREDRQNQVKDVVNLFPTNNDRIRASLGLQLPSRLEFDGERLVQSVLARRNIGDLWRWGWLNRS